MNALARPAPPISWKAAIAGATEEIALYALNFTNSSVGNPVDGEADGLIGAHIPMLGGPTALELAVVGTRENCRAMAGAILTSPPESLSEADVADAVGEIVNQFAGSVKRRMASEGVDLELGLPLFIVGHVASTRQIEVTRLPAHFGPIEMFVLMISRRR